jgi:hypothetical protein
VHELQELKGFLFVLIVENDLEGIRTAFLFNLFAVAEETIRDICDRVSLAVLIGKFFQFK